MTIIVGQRLEVGNQKIECGIQVLYIAKYIFKWYNAKEKVIKEGVFTYGKII